MDAFGARRFGQMNAQPWRHRMRHRDMRDAAGAEEELARACVRSTNWSINTNVPGANSALNEPQAKRDQIGHAGALERVDIGAVVDVAWRQPMALVVAREKDNRQPANLAGQERARRLAPRAFNVLGLRIGQPRQVVDTGAAYYSPEPPWLY
jgi:hypothetical protein